MHSLDHGKNLIIQVVDLGQGEGHCQMSDFTGRPQLFVRLDLTHISPHSNHWGEVFVPVFAVSRLSYQEVWLVTALHCPALHCTALHCTSLNFTVLR